jgi:sialate O-acetylesterase
MSMRRKTLCRIFLIITVLTAVAAAARANVSLPDVISDGMVLQQGKAVPIWGKADPGESVTVRFGAQSRTTATAGDGSWLIRLAPMRANATPAVMTISGKNQIQLKDILVGEVWLVAGQSNMQRLLSETANGEAANAAANHPLIRLFNVSRQVGF